MIPLAPRALAGGTTVARYVGSGECATCHPRQATAWRGSHHAQAMQPADATSVRGDFSAVRFVEGATAWRFLRRGTSFVAEATGSNGARSELVIRYTFGVAPLQQYLVEAPGGRLQALTVAWDARPRTAGGERWFTLQPGERLAPGDPLHWSGYLQNWNLMCADCHSTNLRKNYDPSRREYRSSWSEIAVGCEACHGPGSDHLRWARNPAAAPELAANHGILARLDERRAIRWGHDPATGEPVRSAPRAGDREIETCARCHARRGQLGDAVSAADPLEQGFRAATLDPGLYFPDGQMREEVYDYGSFLQSRMYAAGVTCADCHEPHSGALRATGDALCTQCHLAASYVTARHHFHPADSPGARCVACHLPVRTYMVVDPRHDHSFRIPRPDRSVTLGVPNTCNACHSDRSARWASDEVRRRYPRPRPGFQGFAEAFAAFDAGRAGSAAAVLAVARDGTQSAIARASALARLAAAGEELDAGTLRQLAADRSALVRRAAAAAAHGAPEVLGSLAGDPLRSVRVEAAGMLADPALSPVVPAPASRFGAALADYVDAQRFNADRPEAQTNLGLVLQWQGEGSRARAAFAEALRIDPGFVAAAIDLADLERVSGDERGAERTLRGALPRAGASGAVHHALALSLVRQHRLGEALPLLAEAVRREPGNPRFAYVYAVALHDSGRHSDAVGVLRAAVAHNPDDRTLRQALAAYGSGS